MGYCALGSLFKPNSHLLLLTDSSLAFCLCPFQSLSDRVFCICTKEHSGSQCQWKRPSIHLFLSIKLHWSNIYRLISLFLLSILMMNISTLFSSWSEDNFATHRPIAKLYSSYEARSADLYLRLFSLNGTTQIDSEEKRSSTDYFDVLNACSTRSFVYGRRSGGKGSYRFHLFG